MEPRYVIAESREHRAESKEQRAESKGLNISTSQSPFKSPRLLSGAEASGVAILTHPWLVVKTKTKCEKFVRDRILVMGLDAFVPVQKRTARYNRKVKVFELPLISCYTFVRLDRSNRNRVLALPYVQGVLRMNGKDCHVSDLEMQWLHKVSGIDQEVRTEMISMQKGDQVMIAFGQLAGMEGKIVSQRSKHEVVVALESIGMQMVIHVDPSMLARV